MRALWAKASTWVFLGLFVLAFAELPGSILVNVLTFDRSEVSVSSWERTIIPARTAVADRAGRFFIGDAPSSRVQEYDRDGKFVRTILVPPSKGAFRLAVDDRDRAWLYHGRELLSLDGGTFARTPVSDEPRATPDGAALEYGRDLDDAVARYHPGPLWTVPLDFPLSFAIGLVLWAFMFLALKLAPKSAPEAKTTSLGGAAAGAGDVPVGAFAALDFPESAAEPLARRLAASSGPAQQIPLWAIATALPSYVAITAASAVFHLGIGFVPTLLVAAVVGGAATAIGPRLLDARIARDVGVPLSVVRRARAALLTASLSGERRGAPLDVAEAARVIASLR